MNYNNPEHVKKQTTQKTMDLIKYVSYGHIVEGTYENRESSLVVWCPIHKNEHSTTFYNYNRSKTGCPCCARQK